MLPARNDIILYSFIIPGPRYQYRVSLHAPRSVDNAECRAIFSVSLHHKVFLKVCCNCRVINPWCMCRKVTVVVLAVRQTVYVCVSVVTKSAAYDLVPGHTP